MVYQKHPYRWNTIGKDISHIENATMDDVKSFYAKYYNPNNAIVAVAGDVNVGQIKKLAEKWFGGIKPGTDINRNYPKEPEQLTANELIVDRVVPQNAIYMCWKMQARNEPGYFTTDLISDVLSNGHSSRMFLSLVKNKKLFSEINAFISGDIDPGLFIVSGKLINSTEKTEAENAICEELNKLTEQTVTDQELEKVKSKIEANHIFSSLSVLNKAMYLAYFEMLGEANNWNEELKHYQSVTKTDIMKKAKDLFRKNGQNTLYYKAVNN